MKTFASFCIALLLKCTAVTIALTSTGSNLLGEEAESWDWFDGADFVSISSKGGLATATIKSPAVDPRFVQNRLENLHFLVLCTAQ